jgi:hypothetical protein
VPDPAREVETPVFKMISSDLQPDARVETMLSACGQTPAKRFVRYANFFILTGCFELLHTRASPSLRLLIPRGFLNFLTLAIHEICFSRSS